MIFNRAKFFLVATCVTLLSGCWDSNELGLVPVSGTVTFDGGPAPTEGRVSFSPKEAAPGKPMRTGRGVFSTDGLFTVTSFQPGDGLIPGTYEVKVTCLSGQITESMNQAQIEKLSHVPRGFQPPPLVIEVGSDAVKYDLNVTDGGK